MRMSIPGGIAACARSVMRKSFGLLVVLASAGLATDAVSQPATRQPLPAGFQQGPDALVMPAGAKGNVSPQRAGTAVVVKPSGLPVTTSPIKPPSVTTTPGKPPYRPTVDNPRSHQPCTVHCGPRNVEVRDHRH
jgi:hypothetical protein